MDSKVLGGRYQLLEQIGMGGMAVVYKAMDDLLGRYVAVKILREEYKENEEFIRRFKVESQAAASLSHQNIVQIYDVGEEEGTHYIVMELLEGETLKSFMQAKGEKLSLKEAMNFSVQICRALEHAHSKHVVHRDIKPHNIVLAENSKIKVADFGIARAANNNTTVDSITHAVGSAHYLSPEQARGGYTDHKSDIYSLGVVMYEMFTGKLPFDAEESISIVMQHIHEEAPRPSEIDPSIPAGIEAIIMCAMSKEQRLRYESATQILEDLVAVYQNPSIDIKKLNAYSQTKPSSQSAVQSQSSQTSQASQKQKAATEPKKRDNIEAKKIPSNNRKKKKKSSSSKGLFFGILAAFMCIVIVASFPIWYFVLGLGQEEAEIPNIVGMTHREALEFIEKEANGKIKFTISVERKEHSEEPKDTILKQSPEGGLKTKRSREIKITLSLGPVALELGEYIGRNFETVQQELEAKGVIVTIVHEDNSGYPEGTIFKQFPTEGTKMASGEEVTLYVSKGAENTVVPDVIGKTVDEAIAIIERNNLKVNVVEEFNDSYAMGEVFKQSEKPLSKVPVGTTIEITYSAGKEAEEPDPEQEPEQNPEQESTPEPEKEPAPAPAPAPAPQPAPQPAPAEKKPKTVSITLTGLSTDSAKPTKVKIMLDGGRVFEGDVPSTTGSATIAFEVDSSANSSHSADIYYNGSYRTTKEVH